MGFRWQRASASSRQHADVRARAAGGTWAQQRVVMKPIAIETDLAPRSVVRRPSPKIGGGPIRQISLGNGDEVRVEGAGHAD